METGREFNQIGWALCAIEDGLMDSLAQTNTRMGLSAINGKWDIKFLL